MIKNITYRIIPVEPGAWQLLTNNMAVIFGDDRALPEHMQPVFNMPVSADLLNAHLAIIGDHGFESRFGDEVIRTSLIIWELPVGYYQGARVRLQAQEVQP